MQGDITEGQGAQSQGAGKLGGQGRPSSIETRDRGPGLRKRGQCCFRQKPEQSCQQRGEYQERQAAEGLDGESATKARGD